jgi:hypothetical protein
MQTKEVVEFLKSRETNETPEEHYKQLLWWSIIHDLEDKARMEEFFEIFSEQPLECEGRGGEKGEGQGKDHSTSNFYGEA